VPPADLVARIQADMRKFRKIADDAHIEIK
jgi:hypothetical protein